MSIVIIAEFLIDDENEEKFASHGLSSPSVLQVLEQPHLVAPNRRTDIHRASHIVIGRDNGGAAITVPIEATHVTTLWRPITAWPTSLTTGHVTDGHGRRSLCRPYSQHTS